MASTAQIEKGCYITMRCSPSVIYKSIRGISENFKKRLTDIGFGQFLEFRIDKVEDRSLGLFLLKNVKEDPLRIEFSGKTLPITPEVVHKILGIPLGGTQFPNWTMNEKKAARKELRHICDEKGMKGLFDTKSGKYDRLGKFEVPRWIIVDLLGKNSQNVDDWSVQCFLMILCNSFLFPTSSFCISGTDYLMSKDLAAVQKFDWCKAVVEDIKEKARIWKKNDGEKKTPVIQGCIALLIVYYLDNLDTGVSAAADEPDLEMPRSKKYSSDVIEKLCNADRVASKDGSISYGKLPLLNRSRTVYSDIRSDEGEQQSQNAPTASGVHPRLGGQNVRKAAAAGRGDERVQQSAAGVRKSYKVAAGRGARPRAAPPKGTSDAGTSDSGASSFAAPPTGLPFGFIQLEPLLAESISSFADISQREAVRNAMKQYDSSVARACEVIEEGQRKVDEAKRAIQKGKLDLQQAQKKFLTEVKEILNVNETQSAAPSSRQERAKRRSSATVSKGNAKRQKKRSEAHDAPVSDTPVPDAPVPDVPFPDVPAHDAPSPPPPRSPGGAPSPPPPRSPECEAHADGGAPSPHPPRSPECEAHADGGAPSPPPPRSPECEAHAGGGGGGDGDDDNVVPDIGKSVDVSSQSLTSVIPWKPVKIPQEPVVSSSNDVDDDDTPAYTPPGRRMTHSTVTSSVKIVSGLNTEKVKIAKQKKIEKKTQRKPKKKQTKPKVDKDGFEIPDFPAFVPPPRLGAAMQSSNIVTLGNDVNAVEPFTDEWRRRLPNPDQALQMRTVIFDKMDQEESKSLLYIEYTEKFMDDDVDASGLDCFTSSIRGKDVYLSFSDDDMGYADNADLFAIFMMNDDKHHRGASYGHRIVLPTVVSTTILSEIIGVGEEYDIGLALKYLRMRFTADELISAALVFLPVCYRAHWSLYCINRYHNQIDILDPLDWAQKEDQDRYHAAICGPIQERLNELLYVFTNGVFPAIGQWDMPYVPVPKQKSASNDCVFFCMLYMENYKGSTREMDISFESLKGNEIRAQFLHYLMFHKQNKAPRPFPVFIEAFAPKDDGASVGGGQ